MVLFCRVDFQFDASASVKRCDVNNQVDFNRFRRLCCQDVRQIERFGKLVGRICFLGFQADRFQLLVLAAVRYWKLDRLRYALASPRIALPTGPYWSLGRA